MSDLDEASRVRPSERQVAWQGQELLAFVHFGPNTFTGLEWGTGLEDPDVFAPSALDCSQWAKALVAGGFKGVILTAKHHDGMCLWPTQWVDHKVTKVDVVREAADAARAHGLAFGVYLSPADLYQAERGCYGNGSAAVESEIAPGFSYVVDDYNRYYLRQLYELLTEYAPISEVWLDGANPTKAAQTYAYDAWFDLVRRLAPEATIAIGGPDVRWVGNEDGHARETEWSVVPFADGRMVAEETAPEIAGPEQLAAADELRWYPAEVDVSIRPGWFYHAEEDGDVKSLAKLMDIYRCSVGRNSLLLLNIPPDRRGLFAEADVARLAEFGEAVRSGYGNDLSTALPATFNVVGLSEDIANGQQAEAFAVDALVDGAWAEVATGTTVGYRRLVPLEEPVTATEVRVRVLETRAPTSVGLSLHFDPTLPGRLGT